MQEPLFRPQPAGALPGDPPPTALSLREPTTRARALIERRDKLLRGIARRQADIARLTQTLRDTATKVAVEGPPLFEEISRLSKGIAEMFEAIARSPARSRRERKQIQAMFNDLAQSGLLIAPSDAEESLAEEHEGKPPEFSEHPASPAADQSASPARALFRRLAEMLHPDKVQDEGEKLRRTEVMKQITQAYRSGDYGRLVEIERSLGAAHERASLLESDDYERELHATNQALRKQSRKLDKELRALRAQNAGDVEEELDQAKQIVSVVRVIHDFVASFRDGKVSFKDFMAGPPDLDLASLSAEDVFEEDDVEGQVSVVLDQILSELVQAAPPRPSHRRGRRR